MALLEGKTVLITNAHGLYAANIAEVCKSKGASVIATFKEESGSTNIMTELLESATPVAINSEEDLEAKFTEINAATIIVNNPMLIAEGQETICSTNTTQLEKSLETVKVAHIYSRKFVNHWTESNTENDQAIINLATLASSKKAVQSRFGQSVSMAGIIGLTKSISADHQSNNIRCNVICLASDTSSSENYGNNVANLVAFLGSDQAAPLNGQEILLR